MTNLMLVSGSWHTRFGILLALCLGLAVPRPAAASVIYDFSLAANGSVGAVNIQLMFDTFLPVGGLGVFPLSGPEVTAFSSGTPLDPGASVVGIEVAAGNTLFGISLPSTIGDTVLYTVGYPADFFVFGRTSTQEGTFFSSAGTVTSSLSLDTATPTATLVVTDLGAVPEPATVSLLGLGLLGIAGWRGLRRRSA